MTQEPKDIEFAEESPKSGYWKNNRAIKIANLWATKVLRLPVFDKFMLRGAKEGKGYIGYSWITQSLGFYRGEGVWKHVAIREDGLDKCGKISWEEYSGVFKLMIDPVVSWWIDGVNYTVDTATELANRSFAAGGTLRVDALVGDDEGALSIIVGTPHASTPVAPVIPNNRSLISFYTVYPTTLGPINSIIDIPFSQISGNPSDSQSLVDFLHTLDYVNSNNLDAPQPTTMWSKKAENPADFWKIDSVIPWGEPDSWRYTFNPGVGFTYDYYSGPVLQPRKSFTWGSSVSEIRATNLRLFLSTDGEKAFYLTSFVSSIRNKLKIWWGDDEPDYRGGEIDLHGGLFVNLIKFFGSWTYNSNAAALADGREAGHVYHRKGTLKLTRSSGETDECKIKTMDIASTAAYIEHDDFRSCVVELIIKVNGGTTEFFQTPAMPFPERVTISVVSGDKLTILYR